MRAVGYRMIRVLRARWQATVTLGLIVAAVTGVVLAFAAGAERTSSAPDRYTSASGGGFDGEVEQESGRPRTTEVAALPGVSSVDAVTFVFGALADPGGAPAPDALVFTGSHRAVGMRLVAGRDPDPASRTELVATRSFADARGVALGARFDLSTITQEQADQAGFDAFTTEGAAKRSLEAVLVGVIDGPAELNDATPLAVLPASLLDDPDIGVATTIMSVRLRAGTDLDTFRNTLDSLPDGGALSLAPSELVSSEVRTAVEGQARGLWLLAAVGAIAALVVLGQLVTREVRLSADEAPRLEAIGFSKSQLLAEQVGRAAVPILAGTVLGTAVATGLSSLFPGGFVRRIEPHPGLRLDATVLALCGAGLLVALLVWIVAAVVVARPVDPTGRPSALVESVAARSGSGAFSTGFRFAFTRSRRDRGSIRATVSGMTVTAAVLVGAVVFGSSLGRLVTDGRRFGYNFDVGFGSGGDAVPDEVRASLETDPDVDGMMLYGVGQGRVGSVTLGLAGMEPVKGDVAPTMLTGRLPASDDDIALGSVVAKELGAEVGRNLTVQGAGPARRFRVTGLAVVPGVEGLDGVGQDAVVTMGGLARLDPETEPSAAAISFRKGAPAGTADRLGLGAFSRPIVITNLARIRSIPFVLASVVGALAVLTVVHVMVTSVRNRRRDVAVLRSLGADGRWITRAVHWQATMFSLVPLALGAPLGLIAGRLLFQTFADAVGTVPDASFPYALLLARDRRYRGARQRGRRRARRPCPPIGAGATAWRRVDLTSSRRSPCLRTADEFARPHKSEQSTRRDKGVVMRIILSDFISLDGVVQAPGGRDEDTDGGFVNGGWSMPFFDPETMGPVLEEVMRTTRALLFGRRTWQTMAAAWPSRAGDPFADRMNEIPKHVASRTLTQEDLDWSNSTLLPGDDVIGAVRQLRAQADGDLQVMGSPHLASQLVSNDLVDEYRLMIEPILLGGGKRLFPDDGRARKLELVSTSTSATGVQIATYRPATV